MVPCWLAAAACVQVVAMIIDAIGSTSVSVRAPSTISSGTAAASGLGLAISAVSSWRFVVAYTNSDQYPAVMDLAAFGNAVMLGRYACNCSANAQAAFAMGRCSFCASV
jgi:hypothetical protein